MIVFCRHLLMSFSPFPNYGYGIDKTAEFGLANKWLHQLPIVRIVYSGGAMVSVFFLVSGYVQALKRLQLMDHQNWDLLQRSLASSAFGRGFRLYLPTTAAAILITFAIYLGLYDWGHSYRVSWFDKRPPSLERQATLSMQLLLTWRSYHDLTNVWDWGQLFPEYNIHMWTILYEFRGSLVLYLTLLGLSRLRRPPRMSMFAVLIGFFSLWGRWELCLFLSGALMADIDILRRVHSDDETVMEDTILASTRTNTSEVELGGFGGGSLFILGLFLCSYPRLDGINTYGFQSLAQYVPPGWEDWRFWNSVGAVLIIWSVINVHFIRRLFEAYLTQYLGKISFAIYLTHGPVIHTTAHALIPMMWKIFGCREVWNNTMGFMLPTLFVVLPVLIWVADLFWRLVEVPSAQFTKWLQERLFI
jgi:peptidoglycan/LPS O-acetylase OafA/YrhL